MTNLNYDKSYWNDNKCPKYDCRKNSCKCGLKSVFLSSALGDDSEGSPIAPKKGAYCNAIVVYEANGHIYIYSQEGIPTLVESEGSNVEEIIEQLEGELNQEVLDRQAADNVLQGEIDDIKNSPDVVDIVATYAALQAYDTSHLGDNDIIRVLADETHNGQSTYYRWDKQNSSWTYIGSISAINVVQTTGTSTTDVMSQNATSTMVFADPATKQKIQIGAGASVSAQNYNMALGNNASANGASAMAIGHSSSSRINGIALGDSAKAGNTSSQNSAVAIGFNAQALGQGAIAIGRDSTASGTGVMNIGSSDVSYGYNSTNYRLLTGIHDGQDAHDAATVAQGNTLSTSAPTTSTEGVLGQLWTDTTNMHTYQCTAIDTTDPSNPSYTWAQRW